MIAAGVYYATYGHWTQSLINAGYEVSWHVQPDIRNPKLTDLKASGVLLKNFPLISFGIGPVDLIVGSPPCIGLSLANKFKRSLIHWANKNFLTCFEEIVKLNSTYFLVEFVPPILTLGKPLLLKVLNLLEISSYNIVMKVFNTEEYGSLAKRKRVYFLGSKLKIESDILNLLPKLPQVGCQTALEPLKKYWDNYLPDDFELMSRYSKDGRLRKGAWSWLIKRRKLDPKDAAYTITGTTIRDVLHYDKDRCLSLSEIASLMGFPLDYVFRVTGKESISKVCQMIGSGVDIRFTTYLLNYLKKVLFDSR